MASAVIIYGQDKCPDCSKAVMLAQMQQHNAVYKQLGVDYTLQELQDLLGHRPRSSPQIFVEVDGAKEHIGGYADYLKWAYK